MTLSSISYSQFKGASGSYQLAPMTLIVGGNAEGKSRITRAMVLSLLGYAPGVPKKNREMFDALSSGPAMSVVAKFSDGTENTFKLMEKGDKVTCEIKLQCPVPAVLLDLEEYWDQTRAERVNYLLKRCLKGEDQAALNMLDKEIGSLEEAIKKNDMKRRLLESVILDSNRTQQDSFEPQPVDLTVRIDEARSELKVWEDQLRTLRTEHATRLASDAELKSINDSREKAMNEVPRPLCEHCGNRVETISATVKLLFDVQLAAFYKRDSHRELSLILEDGQKARAQVDHIQKAIEVMIGQQSAWAVDQDRKNTSATRNKELADLHERLNIDKANLTGFRKERSLLLKTHVPPLLAVANLFTLPVAGIELVWDEGVLGYMKDGRLVPWGEFSGMQQKMATAGLMLALAQESPFKIVIMDELGTVHPDIKAKLVDCVLGLIDSGTIHQWIGIDVSLYGWSWMPATEAVVIDLNEVHA